MQGTCSNQIAKRIIYTSERGLKFHGNADIRYTDWSFPSWEGCVTVKDFYDKRFYRKSSPFSHKFLFTENNEDMKG